MSNTKKIVICASANFYKHVNEIADALRGRGFEVIVPQTAEKMRKSGNYDVAAVKTWYENPKDFTKKRQLMDRHFEEVANGDAILVVNDEKHDIPGYIGPNALMEMAVAYYLKKPIFILNKVDKHANIYEEVVGMGGVVIDGQLEELKL